jgi:hypothetical protein
MALKRYIGPFPAVEVRVAGHDYGVVERGAAIAVPDELADQVIWQDENWEDGAAKAAAEKPVNNKPADNNAKDVK